MIKKITIIIILLFISACSKPSIEEIYYTNIEKAQTITKTDNFSLEISIQQSRQNKEYLYEIILANPKFIYQDLEVIALPLEFDENEMVPTFNLLEKQDLSSFNNKKTSIKLNLISMNNYSGFKIVMKYTKENKQYEEVKIVKI